MNMILNPNGMTGQDPVAKELLKKFSVQMADQGLSKDEARSVLEFFRQNDVSK